jgi:hypothetical protein
MTQKMIQKTADVLMVLVVKQSILVGYQINRNLALVRMQIIILEVQALNILTEFQ